MKTFGLIGYPLTHTFSEKYFEKKFQENQLKAEYHLYPMKDLSGFRDFLNSHPDILGLNVTIPYKQQIIPLLDELDDTARKINAVNCITIEKAGKTSRLIGHNTDAFGFENSLKSFIGQLPKKALILGTGGASKAVSYVLDQLGIEYLFVSRSPFDCKHIRYSTLSNNLMNEFKFIINTTPVGMYPQLKQCSPIPYDFIGDEHFLYDLIYNPAETLFLQKGKEAGAQIKNGLEMLELQADRSWEIWNKVK